MLNIDKYLTVRWQMGGRTFPVLDCYGIVHEVRRDLGHGDGVEVRQAEQAVVFPLEIHPILHGSEIIADGEHPRRLDGTVYFLLFFHK